MGTTCSSLHILRLVAAPDDLSNAVSRAYAELGYEPVREAAAGKQVVVRANTTGRFVTLHDSDCAHLDTGVLKQLAVKLSKRLATVAIVTGVTDGDSFEFLVFRAGKQVDAVSSDTPASGSKVKVLKGKKRLEDWSEMFFWPDVFLSMQAAPPSGAISLTTASVADRQRDFEERMSAAGRAEGAFAENVLARWCEVVGLQPEQALTPFGDVMREAGPGTQTFHFARAQAKVSGEGTAAQSTRAIAAPALAWLRSDDDCPYHRFYPAAWPIDASLEHGCRWLVTSSAGGLEGLQLDLGTANPAGVEIDLVGVAAYPFYNGQMTSMTPLAVFEQRTPASDNAIAIAPFRLPDLDPQARKQIVIELRVRFRATGREAFTLSPALVATPSGVSLELPPLTLQPVSPDWHPRVMTLAESRQTDARLRLNSPSVVSAVAMIDDDGAPVRGRVRRFAQGWLTALALPAGATVGVATQTHMSATSFRVSKTAKRYAPEALGDDKLWSRLFEGKSDYQTISFAVHAPGMPHPIAGLNVQAALHDTEGRRPGALLTVSTWMLHDTGIFERLGTAPAQLAATFETWLDGETPAQAWVTQAAWIPEFDIYDEFRQTLYEEAADYDWFRSGMNGKLALRDWADRHLRWVAPRLWLGAPLARHVDLESLRSVADVASPTGQTVRLTLRDGNSVADLERALSAILPPPPDNAV